MCSKASQSRDGKLLLDAHKKRGRKNDQNQLKSITNRKKLEIN
jgi:hypothetical protein